MLTEVLQTGLAHQFLQTLSVLSFQNIQSTQANKRQTRNVIQAGCSITQSLTLLVCLYHTPGGKRGVLQALFGSENDGKGPTFLYPSLRIREGTP